MHRIQRTFDQLKEKNERALVGFLTAGDPDLPTSTAIIDGMCQAGLDVLELGVPFSDPTADGPVIQRSSARALEKGIYLPAVFELTARLRSRTDIPIILFSYFNPILAYGSARFYSAAIDAGADGVLVVVLPPEESAEMTATWPGDELDLIRLVAPTTPAARMARIAATASGFLYLVSKTGVTGSDGLNVPAIRRQVDQLRTVTTLPVCVGFGISTAEQVAAVANAADGVVIGSAFEKMIEDHPRDPALADRIAARVLTYKAATRSRRGRPTSNCGSASKPTARNIQASPRNDTKVH